MKKSSLIVTTLFFLSTSLAAQPIKSHNLSFDSLATRWDEAIPLGNGWLGALIWNKNGKLRISIDRVDLWDDRPMPEIHKLKFSWVIEKVKMDQYDSVQKLGDEPYEKFPAPTKIPGAAIEFDLKKLGKVISNELDIATGLSVIKFSNGTVFNNYIHAVNNIGYFSFENLADPSVLPELIVPAYSSTGNHVAANSVEGQSLELLGYKKGTVAKSSSTILYNQPTWSNNYYEVFIRWQVFPGKRIIGQWTITSNKPARLPSLDLTLKEPTGWPTHISWWKDYWKRSSVKLPDAQLERQYYLEMYKFACVARSNTPPISLQAIWTADDGKLPPWKGDFHHDLNTQLSYWPGYTGNHLDLTSGFTNWLWKVKPENERWTKTYFGVAGLNVPGVTTISGKPMGGWIQYSMSPTTVGWLSQHFYWQWKYGMNAAFLKERLLPYYVAAENFFDRILQHGDSSQLQVSSSPEFHDNSIRAWFRGFTNYDLSIARFMQSIGPEVYHAAGKTSLPSTKWRLPGYSINEKGLGIAPGQELDQSHRHHAHLMPVHPLGILNVQDGASRDIINTSLRHLEKIGTRKWTGYSFTWAACIYARAKEADNAVKHLQIFASNFCSPNSFHLNGDQKGGQYSDFRYRPFTLEGNFAFAQAIHELLLQSHQGYIEVFPAVPSAWKDVSFTTLRAEGAFLVSARRENGVATQVLVRAEAGGKLRIRLPFKTFVIRETNKKYNFVNGILEVAMNKGEEIRIENGYE
jgi:alpha-L-fucosidase 2